MKLVGLDELKNQMDKIVQHADAYRKGGARVPHILINLTQDNGQSIVADYIASVLYENKLRKFCGLDSLLEYRLDGSLKQMKQIFEDIASNAVYTNEFEGVVAIDIAALAEYINEYQVDYFVERIAEVAQNATVVIYYDSSLGKRMDLIKERVGSAIRNHIDVVVSPYSNKEYSEIVVQNILERGIEVDPGSEEELETIIINVVDKYHVSNAKEAVAVADDLVFCVDYSSFTPKINTKMVNEHFCNEKVF